jgi:hypothetical protein
MASYARAVARLPITDTVIYSPVGLYKAGTGWGGIRSAITKANHYSHVHVDTFDRGGYLPPHSRTLAINRTPYWEPVGPPQRGGTELPPVAAGPIGGDVYLDGDKVGRWFRNADAQYRRRNGL